MLMKEYIPILLSKALAKMQFRSPSAGLRIDSSTAQVGTVCSRLRFVSAEFLAFCKVLAHFRKVYARLCKVHRRLRKVLYILLEIPTSVH